MRDNNLDRYSYLRKTALSSTPESLGLEDKQYRDGAVVSGSGVTLFCATTGDASLYTSKGFCVIGGFAHEHVRSTAQAFIELCEKYRDEMTSVDLLPPPREGVLRIYALTDQGVFVAEAPEASLLENQSLTAIRNAGHVVIAALRKIASAD
jgi:hypothetical protein